MLTLQQRKRLKELKAIFGHEIAVEKQVRCADLPDDEETLIILELMEISWDVAGALNHFTSKYGQIPSRQAMALGMIFQTAAKALKELSNVDPELALQLGCVVQSQLEQSLRQDSENVPKMPGR